MTSTRSCSSFASSLLIASLPLWVATTVACGDSKTDGGSGGGGSSSSAGAGTSSGGSSASGGAGSNSGGSKAGGAGASSGGADGGSSGEAGGSSSESGSGTGGSRPEGGSGPKGGTNSGGEGPSVEPGAPCTANCPKGTVQSCFQNCPYGACDDAGLFADVACSTYYPKPINSQTVFCAKDQTANYCLSALDKLLLDYVVSCNAGTPTVTACPAGCGVDDKKVASCN